MNGEIFLKVPNVKSNEELNQYISSALQVTPKI